MKKNIETEKVKKKCSKCGLSFFREYLQRHIDTAHEGIKLYKCDICYSDFRTKNELEKHQKKVQYL